MRALALVVLTACGRLAFDPLNDAGARDLVPGDGTPGDGTTGVGMTGDAALDDGAPAEPDLLMHFAFESDGLLVDRARAHPAACRGTCPPTAGGRIGAAAVNFNGSQCLEIFDAADLRPSSLTASLWVNAQSPPADGEIFSRPRNGATSSNNVMEVFAAANGVWTFNAGSAGIGRPVSAGVWHHVAMTVDSGDFTIYIDGAMMGNTAVGALNYAADSYLIGCERDNNVDVFRFRGRVDDVRLYGRALSAQEIAALASM